MVAICPSLLDAGICLNNACPNRHDTSNFCLICNVALATAAEYNAHIKTSAHSEASKTTQWLQCTPCKRHYIRGSSAQNTHEKSNGHKQKVASHPAGGDPAVVKIAAPPKQTRCDACRQTFPSSEYDKHRRSSNHITRERVYNYNNALVKSQANQRGIEVSGSQNGIDLGIRPLTAANTEPTEISLKCVGQSPVSVLNVRTSSSVGLQSNFQLCFTVTTAPLPVSITPENSIAVQVHFDPRRQRGRFEDRLEFVFKDNTGTFVITRPVKAIAGNNDLAALAPTTPYRRPRRAREREATNQEIINVERDPKPKKELFKRAFQKQPMPAQMRQLIGQGANEDQIRAFSEQFLPAEGLTMATFQQYWSNLVHAEHFQAEIDLKEFDMDDVRLQKTERSYRLAVPGLAEKRPSVIKGDWIKIHPHSKPENVWFRGVVRAIEGTTVLLSLHSSFPHDSAGLYDVQFSLNPVPFQRMLQALGVKEKRSNVLFPRVEDMEGMSNVAQGSEEQDIVLYNHILGSNLEQRNAVIQVTRLPAGSPPFIIFGPPGTGKTVTIVECISQLLDNDQVRVLACAPSNPASDVIAERLISLRGLQPAQLLRLNAKGRPEDELPEDLVPYSIREDNHFSVPSLDKLNSYRVVVSTCSSAALLFKHGVNPGAFTHIFVDEAGQGSEPEVMIPILTMSGPKTNIILGGDPKQLGPVIRSPFARPLGLNLSYLERLMVSPAYDEVAMRGVSVAKLLQNFRSHESIISFPNEQFYRNELIARASPDVANSLLNWNGLPSPKFPVIFEAVAGEDMREATSPSYFNPHEVSLVKDYVQGLLPFIAAPKNIGIVTPYKAQVRKIKKLLKDGGVDTTDLTIGSVEQFQGQERQVIIVSTVRSNKDLLSFDLRHTLGFVANPKRLNVAITRAQSLLVVVGDPLVLGLDTLWRRFLYFVYRSGGWKGAPFPWNPESDPDDDPATFDSAEQDIRELLRRATEPGSPGELDPVGGGDQ
ncbi:putative RNA helicase [Rhizoctonia solani 123E]|uniref:RNA helicase n=1 Tax=Rhizoctonia solani 123E TaxID=1423351 RepID=A0A074S6Q8_9AGAM|nr:putative RNA helicase [Rhizoctonia solani 123E]